MTLLFEKCYTCSSHPLPTIFNSLETKNKITHTYTYTHTQAKTSCRFIAVCEKNECYIPYNNNM